MISRCVFRHTTYFALHRAQEEVIGQRCSRENVRNLVLQMGERGDEHVKEALLHRGLELVVGGATVARLG